MWLNCTTKTECFNESTTEAAKNRNVIWNYLVKVEVNNRVESRSGIGSDSLFIDENLMFDYTCELWIIDDCRWPTSVDVSNNEKVDNCNSSQDKKKLKSFNDSWNILFDMQLISIICAHFSMISHQQLRHVQRNFLLKIAASLSQSSIDIPTNFSKQHARYCENMSWKYRHYREK